MKASDIDDMEFLMVVDRVQHDGAYHPTPVRWALRMEVEQEFPDVPWKVLLAKARKLIRRGLMDGCTCGCRGDYELTAAGLALIHPPAPSSTQEPE